MTGLVGQAEVERARRIIAVWADPAAESSDKLLELRGMIAAALADAYSDGYVAGIQRGKVDTVQRVMETLHDL